MTPLTTLYGEYIDLSQLSKQKKPAEYIVPYPSRGCGTIVLQCLFNNCFPYKSHITYPTSRITWGDECVGSFVVLKGFWANFSLLVGSFPCRFCLEFLCAAVALFFKNLNKFLRTDFFKNCIHYKTKFNKTYLKRQIYYLYISKNARLSHNFFNCLIRFLLGNCSFLINKR